MGHGIEDKFGENLTEQKREEVIMTFAEEKKDIWGYITAWNLSRDSLRRDIYFRRVFETAKESTGIYPKIWAYMFCRDNGKEKEAEDLISEMKTRFPIKGRFHSLVLNLMYLFK